MLHWKWLNESEAFVRVSEVGVSEVERWVRKMVF